jgi:putative transposase
MGYKTDITDNQWELIEGFFKRNKGQHLAEHSKREMVNAVLYLVKTGCQWNLLPNDFPPHEAVRSFFRRAVKSGTWEKAMDCMVRKVRTDAGRNPTPSYGLIDSQSAKTTLASEDIGYDGGKKS